VFDFAHLENFPATGGFSGAGPKNKFPNLAGYTPLKYVISGKPLITPEPEVEKFQNWAEMKANYPTLKKLYFGLPSKMEKSTARSQLSNFLKNNTWVSQVN
jgi:hypothetical protein